ncbi:uncharacterized protein BXZ73DRAFT_77991 [Epithele typhae]|uniref:uncharacterized protein n=1 Tax=Epithele typhae TaxID=378194 RepID=UPI0020082A68|nr:uncharacterized protein BXZ73DRAFT_77991 [Epithele typhae]KAH9929872.1 hypothetical protein BXZ73DRAFT_77991 [Epithele typhae]
MWLKGNGLVFRARPPDSRVTTILVTLPIKFRDRGARRGFTGADLEWTALIAGCEYEVQPVRTVTRMTLVYVVHIKGFATAGFQPDLLITPSDQFLDMRSPRRKIAFYDTADYGVNPGEVVAESLVPSLKGGDSMLLPALKICKLVPELRWTVGGYIWPVDQTVEMTHENAELASATESASTPTSTSTTASWLHLPLPLPAPVLVVRARLARAAPDETTSPPHARPPCLMASRTSTPRPRFDPPPPLVTRDLLPELVEPPQRRADAHARRPPQPLDVVLPCELRCELWGWGWHAQPLPAFARVVEPDQPRAAGAEREEAEQRDRACERWGSASSASTRQTSASRRASTPAMLAAMGPGTRAGSPG